MKTIKMQVKYKTIYIYIPNNIEQSINHKEEIEFVKSRIRKAVLYNEQNNINNYIAHYYYNAPNTQVNEFVIQRIKHDEFILQERDIRGLRIYKEETNQLSLF